MELDATFYALIALLSLPVVSIAFGEVGRRIVVCVVGCAHGGSPFEIKIAVAQLA